MGCFTHIMNIDPKFFLHKTFSKFRLSGNRYIVNSEKLMFFRPFYIMAVRSLTYIKNSFALRHSQTECGWTGGQVFLILIWMLISVRSYPFSRYLPQYTQHWQKVLVLRQHLPYHSFKKLCYTEEKYTYPWIDYVLFKSRVSSSTHKQKKLTFLMPWWANYMMLRWPAKSHDDLAGQPVSSPASCHRLATGR